MKVLFIGGTGVISSACSELALSRGIELYLLNRGRSVRPAAEGTRIIHADARDPRQAEAALSGMKFDVAVDWIAYTPEHVQADIELLRGRVGQYIFISSATVYQKPPASLPITESAMLHNPFWEYARNKIACENLLTHALRSGFPATIVRPSHTYDRTMLPTAGRYTAIARMRQGKPVVVHGDGTSTWTLTHHRDFAKGFVGLLGNPRVVGEAFHITSDELLTWNQIYLILARAAGADQPRLVHAPSELIARYDTEWGAGLLGDKSHSVVFDNSKIKRFVPDFAATIPFARGAEEIIAWYDADPGRQVVDPVVDRVMDAIIAWMGRETA